MSASNNDLPERQMLAPRPGREIVAVRAAADAQMVPRGEHFRGDFEDQPPAIGTVSRRLLHRWWLILPVTLSAGIGAHLLGNRYFRPTFEAVALVHYAADQPELADAVRSQALVLGSTETIGGAVARPEIARWLARLNAPVATQFAGRARASVCLHAVCQAAPVPHTEFIRVWSSSSDAAVAAALANGSAEALVEQCRTLPPTRAAAADAARRRDLKEELSRAGHVLNRLNSEKSGLLGGDHTRLLMLRRGQLDAQIERVRELRTTAEADRLAAVAELQELAEPAGTRVTAGPNSLAPPASSATSQAGGSAEKAAPQTAPIEPAREEWEMARRRRLEIARRQDPVLRAAIRERVAALTDYWEELATGKTEAHRDVVIARRRVEQAERAVAERDSQLAAAADSGAGADARLANAARAVAVRSRLNEAAARVGACDKDLAELNQQSGALNAELVTTDGARQHVEQLEEEATRATRAYDDAWQRLRQMDAVGKVESPVDVKVARWATVPTEPMEDPRPLMRAGGWSGGLLVGLFAAFGLGRIDRRLHKPQDLERAFGAPLLGSISRIKHHGLLPDIRETERIGDEIRAVRTRLLLLQRPGERRVTVCVASVKKGDERTSLAVALGVSLAKTDRRVLMLDGSPRRPALHRLFAINASPGLADILLDGLPPEQAIQPTELPSTG